MVDRALLRSIDQRLAKLPAVVLRGPRQVAAMRPGAASGRRLRRGSESIAGRVGYLELTPFLIDEEGGVAGEVPAFVCAGGRSGQLFAQQRFL